MATFRATRTAHTTGPSPAGFLGFPNIPAPVRVFVRLHIVGNHYSTDMSDVSLNLKQAAAYLKVHPVTLSRLAASGRVPGAKIGRSWVFREEELSGWLQEEIASQTAERSHSDTATTASSEAPPLARRRGRPRRRLPVLTTTA